MKNKKKSRISKLGKQQFKRDLLVISFGIVLAFLFVFAFDVGDIKSGVYTKVYKTYARNDYTSSLANVCSVKNSSMSKVLCVHKFFDWNYNFIPRRKIAVSPEILMKEGGDCSDSAVFFCAVFEYYEDINCKIITLPQHVINVVSFEGGICNIDQMIIDCYGLVED